MSNATKPVAQVKNFPISASIWRNEKDGRAYYSVTFQRTYKDDAGDWNYTDKFYAGDLLLLAKVADQAHTEISKLQAGDRQAPQPEDQAA